jgi:hypothetical protein
MLTFETLNGFALTKAPASLVAYLPTDRDQASGYFIVSQSIVLDGAPAIIWGSAEGLFIANHRMTLGWGPAMARTLAALNWWKDKAPAERMVSVFHRLSLLPGPVLNSDSLVMDLAFRVVPR